MKLYTEEQVRVAMSMSFLKDYDIATNKQIIESLKYIELPSDEEIDKLLEPHSDEYAAGFIGAIEIIEDQIKQQEL